MCEACLSYLVFERAVDEYGLTKAVSDGIKKILDTLNGSWVEASDKAIDDAMKAFNSASTIEAGIVAMLAVLGRGLDGGIVPPDKVIVLRTITRDAYAVTKARLAKPLGPVGDMTDLDIRLARKIADEGPYWIGNFYTRELSDRISAVAEDAIIGQGYGRKEAAKVLDSVLRQEFSLYGGKSSYAAEVPARFAGNLDNYNTIQTSNVAGRVRNFGHMTAMGEANVERFRFTAVMDERTSEVCQEMDGREFSVAYAVARLEQIAEADSPEAFKELAPWPKNANQLIEIAGTGSQAEQNARLEAAGFQFPPLHGMCRSLVEQVL